MDEKNAIVYNISFRLPAGAIQPSLEDLSIAAIDTAKRLGLVYNGISWVDEPQTYLDKWKY